MGIKQLREDEKGSGLVLTLMVLLVLSVLGVSIGTLTLGSYRLSAANRDDTSAYYVAEAGAVAAYEEIQGEVLRAYENNATEGSFYNHVSSIVTAQNGQSSVDFAEQFGTEPTATIATAQKDSKIYTITSTGEVDGKKRTVTKQFTVNWVEKNTGGGGLPALPANGTLITQGNIKITGGNITGDIYTNSTTNKGFEIGNEWPDLRSSTLFYSNKITAEKLLKYPKDYVNFPKLVARETVLDSDVYIPNFKAYKDLLDGIKTPDKNHLVNKGDLNISSNDGLNLDSDVYIPKIKITSDATYTINTAGQDRTILVDNLDVAGSIKVTGGGKLTIYITKSFPEGYYNLIKENPQTQLNLVYLGTATLKINNGSTINGNIIIKSSNPHANVNVDIGGGATINGIFLTNGNKVNVHDGAKGDLALIAPTGIVTFNGSGPINGTVIANQFDMSGGASLTYAAIDTTGFLFGSAAPAADPEPEDIISSEPIIEN
ncbi:PilX N-terminal domain-containing pilus assembly protein [uncultured Trichococcus sp.]|uniref:PilX N-terminal domain-containing pilus assembly protein n=1 Tax=uncultured Trichococcus sp. TaxID=189665 RepID=UPI002A18BD42|nr:PilX N-terminal domain-containing pilus assembly protein [uncultured Trichococcus sp.]